MQSGLYYKRLGKREALLSFIGPYFLYTSLALSIAYTFWPYFYYIKSEHIIVIGIFTLWRYSWLFANYVRSLIYHNIFYPRLKRHVNALIKDRSLPNRIYFVIPSYQEEPWVTLEMLQSLLSELQKVPCDATVVMALGSHEEEKIVASIVQSHPARHKVDFVIQRQSEGKRVAMGDALRAVAREYYSEDEDYNSVTFLMDGDTVLSPHTVKDSISFFMALPELGALTTNEVAYTPGGSRWYKDWFNMKFGQRHIMFGSHALSMRVLTLTGRFSAFRTAAVVRSVFIEKVEQDFLEEPFHGRFRFLMGDDKSTWFQMLKEGWDMLYLPDRVCYALESRGGNFISESLSLLYRWYGNTFRNNKRALALGPKRVGGFLIWLSILDQKLSMWTALVGITSAIILSFRIHPVYLAIYIAWVLLVRSVQMAALAVGKHPVSIRTIPLMLYNQWIGALVKIWVNSHLAQQKWQKGAEEQDAANLWIRVKHPLARVLPNWAMLCSTLLFILVLCFSEEVLKMPDIYAMAGLFRPASNSLVIDAKAQGVFSGSNDVSGILNRIIQGAPDFSVISLPRGELQVKHPIVIKRSNIAIAGEETTLVGSGMNPGDAVILIQGESRKLKSPLAGDLDQGSSALWFENRCPLKPRDVIIVRRPNDEVFFDSIGSVCWRRKYPYIRQEIMQVTEVDGDAALLNRDLFFSYPREKAEIFSVVFTFSLALLRLARFHW